MKTAIALKWIEEQKLVMLDVLKKWASINSWSENPAGLQKMASSLQEAFAPLADTHCEENLVLMFSKRKGAKSKILLGGHYDTVYPESASFQVCREEGIRLRGPGVADMKGGLVVLLLGLSAFEKFNPESKLGWEIILNPDEEIGSPGSRPIWLEKAKTVQAALLFEPSFSDGALVDRRKGSMNFHLLVEGKAAHAGRDYSLGRSAVKAIAKFVSEAYALSDLYPDLSLNVTGIHNTSPLNVVAEKAHCYINMRSFNSEDLNKLQHELFELSKSIGNTTETKLTLTNSLKKEPKLLTAEVNLLLEHLKSAASQLKLSITTRASGGLSDGNILAEAGLPSLDTLGVIGGNLHTSDEYMEIESMVERAKLLFIFLTELSEGKHATC